MSARASKHALGIPWQEIFPGVCVLSSSVVKDRVILTLELDVATVRKCTDPATFVSKLQPQWSAARRRPAGLSSLGPQPVGPMQQ